MAYNEPQTVTAAELITVQKINEEWQDSIRFLANPPACRVYQSATFTCNNGADTIPTFNSERYDTDSMHSVSVNTDRITINTAGLYIVGAWVSFASDTDYLMTRTQLLVNVSATIIAENTSTQTYTGSISADNTVNTIWKFTAGDYIRLQCFQVNTSGGNNVAQAEFWATWIGIG